MRENLTSGLTRGAGASLPLLYLEHRLQNSKDILYTFSGLNWTPGGVYAVEECVCNGRKRRVYPAF
jgi:hypothetical protein